MGTIGLILIVFLGVCIGFDTTSHKKYVNCELNYNTTTVIKGVAIFIIILSHIGGNLSIRFLTPLGGIGVAMFLFLSGYGLSKSYEKNQLLFFWRKRFIAIYPAYLIANIIAWIMYGVSDVKTILLGIVFVKPTIPYGWFFQYLILWYIIFWIAEFILGGKKVWAILIISAIFSFCFLPEIMAEQSISFIAGVFVSDKKYWISKIVTEEKKICVSCSLILIGLLFLGIKQIEIVRAAPQIVFNVVQLLIKLPISIGIVTLLLSSYINKTIKYRLFFLLGQISYELYLLHGMCINYIDSTNVVYIMLSLLASIFFAWLLKIFNVRIGKTMRALIIESDKV